MNTTLSIRNQLLPGNSLYGVMAIAITFQIFTIIENMKKPNIFSHKWHFYSMMAYIFIQCILLIRHNSFEAKSFIRLQFNLIFNLLVNYPLVIYNIKMMKRSSKVCQNLYNLCHLPSKLFVEKVLKTQKTTLKHS